MQIQNEVYLINSNNKKYITFLEEIFLFLSNFLLIQNYYTLKSQMFWLVMEVYNVIRIEFSIHIYIKTYCNVIS